MEIIKKINDFFLTASGRISREKYNEEIEEALGCLNNGERISHSEVIEELDRI